MVANLSHEALTIPKATVIGIAEEEEESLVHQINTDSNLRTRPHRKGTNEVHYQKLLPKKLDHFYWENRQMLEPVSLKYAHVFHDEETDDFKGTGVIENQIIIGDVQPMRRPPVLTPYSYGAK
jgi:hypothetical protein